MLDSFSVQQLRTSINGHPSVPSILLSHTTLANANWDVDYETEFRKILTQTRAKSFSDATLQHILSCGIAGIFVRF